MRCMTREAGSDDEEPMWQSFKIVPTPETKAAVSKYVQDNLHDYSDLPLDTGGMNPTKRVKKRWWAYLRWLYDLQWYMQGQESRLFSILPLSSFASKNICIDTGILWGLLKRVAKKTGRTDPEALPLFRTNRQEHWATHFTLSKAEGNKHRAFDHMLRTDGLAVSAILTKHKADVVTVPDPVICLDGKRVIGMFLYLYFLCKLLKTELFKKRVRPRTY